MGMQVTFSEAEAKNADCEVEVIHHAESDTYSALIRDNRIELDAYITVNYSKGIEAYRGAENNICWFDVGRANPEQMAKVAWLIRRRICFTCA